MSLSPAQSRTQIKPHGGAALRLVVDGNPEKEGLVEALGALVSWAGRRGARVAIASPLCAVLEMVQPDQASGLECFDGDDLAALGDGAGDEGTLLVCLGGDGSLIHAARRFWPFRASLLAVHLGSLGFNTAVEPAQLEAALEAWAAGECTVSERMVIRATLGQGDMVKRRSVAFNDVVLNKPPDAHLIHLVLRQGAERVSAYAADGLIVATPTGSTAYNLSAGGPILFPTLHALVATAICPHTLGARPVVLPPTPPISMEFLPHHGSDYATISLDGQETFELARGERLWIEAEPEPLRLATLPGQQYFARLRDKLNWSGHLPNPVADAALGDDAPSPTPKGGPTS